MYAYIHTFSYIHTFMCVFWFWLSTTSIVYIYSVPDSMHTPGTVPVQYKYTKNILGNLRSWNIFLNDRCVLFTKWFKYRMFDIE